LWAAQESALRHAARPAGIEVKSAAPGYLLRAFCAKGTLVQSEFDRLNEALRIRNSLVRTRSGNKLLLTAILPLVPVLPPPAQPGERHFQHVSLTPFGYRIGAGQRVQCPKPVVGFPLQFA
jgi:hypothetical protein